MNSEFWFNFRKIFFQIILAKGLIPIIILDYLVNFSLFQKINGIIIFSLILFISFCKFLKYFFEITSQRILIKRRCRSEKTSIVVMDIGTSNIFYVTDLINVFHLKYSDSSLIRLAKSIGTFVGINTPIIIPVEVVTRLGFIIENNNNDIATLENIISNLHNYQPYDFDHVRISDDNEFNDIESLIPKQFISPIDSKIISIKKDLFGKIDV
jgi:hypothetical protein